MAASTEGQAATEMHRNPAGLLLAFLASLFCVRMQMRTPAKIKRSIAIRKHTDHGAG
jgi:hypothetical protein